MKIALTLLLIVAMPAVSFGTVQAPDKLVDEHHDERDMVTTPLEDYFSNDYPRPKWLMGTSTACWRGYIGAWQIRDRSLFLTSLHRNVGPRLRTKERIPLNQIFRDAKGPVRADWFSGVLRVLDGKRITAMGMHPVKERDIFISIVRGKVIGKRTVDIMSEDQSSWSDLSWQDLAVEPNNTQGSPLVVDDAGLEEGDWLDGQRLSKRIKDLVKNQATFNVRGLYLGTTLWVPPIRLGESQERDQYEFAREGLYLYLDYAPNLDTKTEAHSRMVGTTVEITAKFTANHPVGRHHWTLLVSEVKQLPSGAAIQKRIESNEKKEEQEDSNRPR